MVKHLNLINQYLNEYIISIENNELREAIGYSLMPGGKRLRPMLLLTILSDLNIDLELGIFAACSLEMIHTYSLIHDDLPAMDNDDIRRGRPTLHKKFTESLAILAADALLTDAFGYLCKGNISADVKIKLIALASHNSGSNGMVTGQVLDITSDKKDVSLEDVEMIHLHKTKDLINQAIISGGLIANMNNQDLELLEKASYYVGLGFQIKDDIDDLISDANSDLKNDKATYPKVLGLEKSIKILNDYKSKALTIIKTVFSTKELYTLIEGIL